jgi:bifunctional non-homologous end joining protein LigD
MPRDLSTYRGKRRFERTDEPAGDEPVAASSDARFSIQEHSARRWHLDLRLERDGVLVSFALPNGLPDDPKQNRKAVHTEDHPLQYLEWEGEIPRGEYGAGTMKLWDMGTYEAHEWKPRKLVIALHGRRAQGRYALFQAGRDEKDWLIHRMDPPARAADPMPEHVVPMLALLSTLPEDDEGFAFEVKWDGVRAVAFSEPGRFRLESRNLLDVTDQYPELRAIQRQLGARTAVLDGEIVAFDDEGRPSFERLQRRMHVQGRRQVEQRREEAPVTYLAFDLLYLDGESLTERPYTERRELLEGLGLAGEAWSVPPSFRGRGADVLAASAEQGLEGVVAKRLASPYRPGRRTGEWLKIKNQQRQEVVIGGWTPGKGRRAGEIGALLVGVYDDDGRLRYAGKVGTGFTGALLEELKRELEPLARPDSPFAGRQPARGSAFCEPRLVCEVEFTEWTRDGMLRHPSFKGLREDKDPGDVVRERVVDAAAEPPPEPGEEPADAPAAVEAASRLTLAGLTAGRRPDREGRLDVAVDGRELSLSNLSKPLYPNGFTKGGLIDYYLQAAEAILPHLADRPLTLKRYPNGVEGGHFFEKQCPKHRPPWVVTRPVFSRTNDADINFCIAGDRPTLVWLANLAAIELHTSLSTHDPERPTVLVFDLDPGPGVDIVGCCEIGLVLRGMFEQLGLQTFAKTSGSKGLQLYLPLNEEGATYERTKPFALEIAELLERQLPDKVVSRMTKSIRKGRVLIDWSQNDPHKTTVCAYSVRAKAEPTVSTPVTWDEVEACLEAGDADRLRFTTAQVLERIERHGDLFAPVVSCVQRLPA